MPEPREALAIICASSLVNGHSLGYTRVSLNVAVYFRNTARVRWVLQIYEGGSIGTRLEAAKLF